ncbi:MAG: hypothetical protein AAB548_03065, partial [Patescibacteria group bacterium]
SNTFFNAARTFASKSVIPQFYPNPFSNTPPPADTLPKPKELSRSASIECSPNRDHFPSPQSLPKPPRLPTNKLKVWRLPVYFYPQNPTLLTSSKVIHTLIVLT